MLYIFLIFCLLVLVILFIYTTFYYRKIAYYDDLTGVLRRGKFEKELVKRMKFVKNNPEFILQLYMIDLDDFKSINDTYGHKTGDAVLIRIAENLKISIRRFSFTNLKFGKRIESKFPLCYHDIVGRLGGDEFSICCILPANEHENVKNLLINTLNKNIGYNFKSTFYSSCTISIGLSVFDYNMPINVEKLKDETDKKLYISKKNGKGIITE